MCIVFIILSLLLSLRCFNTLTLSIVLSSLTASLIYQIRYLFICYLLIYLRYYFFLSYSFLLLSDHHSRLFTASTQHSFIPSPDSFKLSASHSFIHRFNRPSHPFVRSPFASTHHLLPPLPSPASDSNAKLTSPNIPGTHSFVVGGGGERGEGEEDEEREGKAKKTWDEVEEKKGKIDAYTHTAHHFYLTCVQCDAN